MKKCSRCKTEKSTDGFAKNKAKKDGLQTVCRVCVKEINAAYYRKTPEKNAARLEASRRNRERNRQFVVSYLREHPCVDCGEDDPVVLEFDHVRGSKLKSISVMIVSEFSLAALEKEIEKCDVRCANCHRRVTASRGNWWRTLN